MAKTGLRVFIGDLETQVGTLWFEFLGNREHSIFQYEESWVSHPRRFAIAPHIPLDGGRMFFKAAGEHASPLPLPIADTTPDAWGRSIIRKDSKGAEKPTSPLTEIDFLTSVDDFSRVGALRFRSMDSDVFLAKEIAGKHPVPPLIRLDQLARDVASAELEESDKAALRRLRQIGTALGGARPKCSVIDKDGSLAIAKFTSQLDQFAVERAEVMTLNLARRCGIETPAARIEMSANLPVAIITRFDRVGSQRLAYISGQSMLGCPTAIDSTYVDLADAIRQHAEYPNADLTELFKRISFTILVSNVDDHLKNHGFIYASQGKWRLSPAFDINPAPERHRELKTAISNRTDPSASIELLMNNAMQFDVGKDQAANIVRQMATTISAEWEDLANSTGMSRREINQYRPALDHEEARFAMRKLFVGGFEPPHNQATNSNASGYANEAGRLDLPPDTMA